MDLNFIDNYPFIKGAYIRGSIDREGQDVLNMIQKSLDNNRKTNNPMCYSSTINLIILNSIKVKLWEIQDGHHHMLLREHGDYKDLEKNIIYRYFI